MTVSVSESAFNSSFAASQGYTSASSTPNSYTVAIGIIHRRIGCGEPISSTSKLKPSVIAVHPQHRPLPNPHLLSRLFVPKTFIHTPTSKRVGRSHAQLQVSYREPGHRGLRLQRRQHTDSDRRADAGPGRAGHASGRHFQLRVNRFSASEECVEFVGDAWTRTSAQEQCAARDQHLLRGRLHDGKHAWNVPYRRRCAAGDIGLLSGQQPRIMCYHRNWMYPVCGRRLHAVRHSPNNRSQPDPSDPSPIGGDVFVPRFWSAHPTSTMPLAKMRSAPGSRSVAVPNQAKNLGTTQSVTRS